MSLAIIPTDIVQALCWTLLHSLWQGLLLAIITGVILLATKKAGAAIRYKLLTGLFFLFAATAIATFIKIYAGIVPVQQLSASEGTPLFAPDFILQEKQIELSLLQRFSAYFNQHASLIITVWFVIFLARLIKLIGNLLYIQRIRHYKTHTPSSLWQDNVLILAAKMNLNKQVKLLESAIVKVPAVIGIAKPVILIPLGMLTRLPVEEIEAILLHELAHIQRRDYLINLLQSMMETIFFFNPAILWLSSMIREERENCCDDMAIAITNNKTKFINALISFQEYNLTAPAHSMAFPGKKNHLLNRVKRIVHERNKTLNSIEKSVLTLSIALLICFSFIAAKKDTKAPKEKEKQTTAAATILQDTIAKPIVLKLSPVYDSTGTQQAVATSINGQEASDSSGNGTNDSTTQLTLTLNAAPPQDTTKKISFRQMSTDAVTNDSTSSLSVAATTTTGVTYVLKKKNGNITYFSIDSKEIEQANYKDHLAEISAIEQAIDFSKHARLKKINFDYQAKQLEDFKRAQVARDDAFRVDEVRRKQLPLQNNSRSKDSTLRKKIQFDRIIIADSIREEKKNFHFEPKGLFKKTDTLHLKPSEHPAPKKIQLDSKQWVMSGDMKLAPLKTLPQ